MDVGHLTHMFITFFTGKDELFISALVAAADVLDPAKLAPILEKLWSARTAYAPGAKMLLDAIGRDVEFKKEVMLKIISNLEDEDSICEIAFSVPAVREHCKRVAQYWGAWLIQARR